MLERYWPVQACTGIASTHTSDTVQCVLFNDTVSYSGNNISDELINCVAGMVPTRENLSIVNGDLSQCHSVHHKSKSTGLASNPYLHGEKPNRLSRGGRGISPLSSAAADNERNPISISPHTFTT